jgi:hypothetical protein
MPKKSAEKGIDSALVSGIAALLAAIAAKKFDLPNEVMIPITTAIVAGSAAAFRNWLKNRHRK